MTDEQVTETRDRNLRLVKGAVGARPEPTKCPGLALLQKRRGFWKEAETSTSGTAHAKRMFHALDYYCDVARWAAGGGQTEAPRLELMGTLFSDGTMPREAAEVAIEAARLVKESK